MKGTIFKNVIIPLLLGLLALFFEAVLFGQSSEKMKIAGFILISSIFTILLLLNYKRFDVCGWFLITNCGGMLIIILYALLTYYGDITYTTAYLVMANWLGVTLTCFIVRLVGMRNRISFFNNFFRLSSIIFGCLYLLVFIYALFLKPNGCRQINLIPLKDIIHDLVETSEINILYSNTFINIFLFIPCGFYLSIIGTKLRIHYRLGILLAIPVIIEILQYITNSGISDIDDVILDFTGGLIGMLLLFVLEKLYTLIHKNNKEKMLEF